MNNVIKTTCPYCGVGCGLEVDMANDTVEIRPDADHPANFGRICTKGAALDDTIDITGRLLHPLVRGRRVSWDTALDRVAAGFRQTIETHGPHSVAFYVSGQLLTEDYYVANKLMKGFIGSGNIDTNSRLCMASAVAGHQRAFGEDLVPCDYADLEQADLIVITGSNLAWCHPVLFQRIQDARERRPDMKLIVIDPRRTATSDAADLHLQLKAGTDLTLFNGLLAYLDSHGCTQAEFIRLHTEGYQEALAAACRTAADPAAAAHTCDLSRKSLLQFYEWFSSTERTVTLFSQGINQSSSGTDKVNAIINCHLSTGRIGRSGSGPFSITGQPNAMGGREVGGLASTLAAHMQFDDPGAIDRLRRFWHSDRVASDPGLKAVELFNAIAAGRIKALWIMGTNPVVSMPDADAVWRALAACEMVVVSDCSQETDTARCADILLPAAAWGEKDGTVTNSERRISRQRQFLPIPGEARPDWWIITQVARRMGYNEAFAYQHPAEIFDEHARLSAFENDGARVFNIGGLIGLAPQDYDNLQPVQWPVLPAGARCSGDRLFAQGRFATPEHRARFIAAIPAPCPAQSARHFPLILNTGRVRDHWHTLTRTGKSPRLSAHTPEPYVAIHPDDAEQDALVDQELVEVRSTWGRLVARVRIDDAQRRGEIFVPMHWNNQFGVLVRVGAVVNAVVDPISGEPEFKFTPVAVKPWPADWYGFLLSRQSVDTGHGQGIDYWIRIRGENFWRIELAGKGTQFNRAPWARRMLGAVKPGADWLEYNDAGGGNYRVAHIDADGRLLACLFIAWRPSTLPARDWLGGLFIKPRLDDRDRDGLLTGTPIRTEDADSVIAR